MTPEASHEPGVETISPEVEPATPQAMARTRADELERRIASAETEIGRAVWREVASGASPPPGGEVPIEATRQAAARIALLRQQAAELEATIAAGAKARSERADPSTHCSACRAPRTAGDRFCPACGQTLTDPLAPALGADLSGTPAPPTEAQRLEGAPGGPEPVRAPCDRCGEAVRPKAAFCTRCGWRVALSTLPWWRARWLRVLLGGLVLYVFCQAILPQTNDNAGIIAAELVIGALLVPLTFVTYFFERGTLRQTPLDVLVLAFVLGAVLGGGAAAVLEAMGTYALSVLIAGLVAGGPAAGASSMVAVLNVRGVLAPLGHGTWTGILAGVMWYERSEGRSPFNRRVVLTYVAVSLLHGLYDIAISSHVLLISFVSGTKVALPGICFGLLGLVALVAMVHLVRRGDDPVTSLAEHLQNAYGALHGAAKG